MKTYNCTEKPFRVFGIPFFDEKKIFERLPDDLCETIPRLKYVGKRCPGARIGFCTDAEEFTVKIALKTLSPDIGMSIFACQSATVMIGNRDNPIFAGLVNPPNYETKVFERSFTKNPEMEEITVWLPRNEEIESIEIILPDDAKVEEPTPYKCGPVLFYGSSITEGGCCSSVTNNYIALLSRWLDMDFYNFGFSGSALGEPEVADYINTVGFSAFVLDYDHNAPTAEHLKKTHEAFFKRIRKKNPDMPILMLARTGFDNWYDSDERRQTVKATYENAIAAGDKNVYYIPPEEYFGEKDCRLYTVDRTHPNDLGFYRMAEAIYPVMRKMLDIDQ